MSVRQWRGRRETLPIVDDEGSNFFCRASRANVSQSSSSVKGSFAMPRSNGLGTKGGGNGRGAFEAATVARTLHCD